MIRFNTADTWGFPVFIKISAIITPNVVVTVTGMRSLNAEIDAVGAGLMIGAENETG